MLRLLFLSNKSVSSIKNRLPSPIDDKRNYLITKSESTISSSHVDIFYLIWYLVIDFVMFFVMYIKLQVPTYC